MDKNRLIITLSLVLFVMALLWLTSHRTVVHQREVINDLMHTLNGCMGPRGVGE